MVKESQERHHEAMKLLDKALLAKGRGNAKLHLNLLTQAFEAEQKAASLIASNIKLEPTRSVLHRSAATLAIQCGRNREAERLIDIAMSGVPPVEIADELRDLLESIRKGKDVHLQDFRKAE
jgi:hypothetical protein